VKSTNPTKRIPRRVPPGKARVLLLHHPHLYTGNTMSKSGQQHPKADNGGQRPAEDKASHAKSSSRDPSTAQTAKAGDGRAATKDAKK